jgi:hypothetical protein
LSAFASPGLPSEGLIQQQNAQQTLTVKNTVRTARRIEAKIRRRNTTNRFHNELSLQARPAMNDYQLSPARALY